MSIGMLDIVPSGKSEDLAELDRLAQFVIDNFPEEAFCDGSPDGAGVVDITIRLFERLRRWET
jgi:hypothetical protein